MSNCSGKGSTTSTTEKNNAASSLPHSGFLLNRKSSVPPREMAEALWPEESMDIESLSNNMRGLLFRLRNTFGLICQHNLIESTPNGYRLSPKLNIMTDLQQFDKCCDAVPRAISTSEKIDLLK